jgi:citrate lyase subunit beta/citryl-CoA lyase
MKNFLRPRRSVLYMPASNDRALEKARSLPADALILDLEDAVAPDAKAAARAAAVAAADSRDYGEREVVIRINGADTPWAADDLHAVARSAADAILLPKVDGPEIVASTGRFLREAGSGAALWVMAEIPKTVQLIDRIATADPALQVIVMGLNDLAKALRVPADPQRSGLLHAMGACVLAARTQGLDILDGVYGDLDDEPGLIRECEQARALGFDGKTLIHPRQIATANALFGVSADEATRCKAIVAAWDKAATAGQGVAVLDGQMIEALHADAARRVLALYAAIQARAED